MPDDVSLVRRPAFTSWAMRRTASSMPQNTALLTIEWPMLSSSISGMAATGWTF